MKSLLFIYTLLSFFYIQPHNSNNLKVCIVAFYNLENFYDTINNPIVNDDDFTPEGIKHYTSDIYLDKVTKLSTVISQLASDITQAGPAILGVAEIENDTVLNDLIHHPLLQNKHYQFIHYDSKDARGIDVALIYQPTFFVPEKAEKLFVTLPGNSKEAYFTRDILYVKGQLGGETVHIYINHWPSRRGGEERSSPARDAAALVCKKHANDILHSNLNAKIIIMGDLNDDPDSHSITTVLKAKRKIEIQQPYELFNPWATFYENGIGTLANRDSWGLFDQIILSKAWLDQYQEGLYYYQARIFSRNFLKEDNGRFKGYPMRTWDGNTYRGGYSDHFPTYIILLKKLK